MLAHGQETQTIKRVLSIDRWRGIGVGLVVMSHLFHGLYGGEVTVEVAFENPIILFYSIMGNIAPIFFFTSGFSAIYSVLIKKGKGDDLRTIAIATLVRGFFMILFGTFYDFLVFDFRIVVGTLQIIGFSDMIISGMFLQWLKKKEKASSGKTTPSSESLAKRYLWLAFLVTVFSPVARMVFGYPVFNPDIDHFVYCETPTTPLEYLQGWLTTSFFPIFPFSAYFFFGAYIALKTLVMRPKPIEYKKFMNRIALLGIIFMIAAFGIELVGEEVAGDLAFAPQNEQPWWALELLFSLQPSTTGVFLLYLGMNMVGMYICEYAFTGGKISGAISANLERFSRDAFTIYILQFVWMIVFRFVRVFTGINYLYSMGDILAITLLIIIVEIGFLVFAWYHAKHEYKYGFNEIVHFLQDAATKHDKNKRKIEKYT